MPTSISPSIFIKYLFFIFFGTSVGCKVPVANHPTSTFTNPLLASGADPWSIYKDGFYYYTHTQGDKITIWKTKSLANLKTAEKKTVWTPPANTLYSKQIWAPELHFINDKWYVYFAADDGNNNNHRMYVIENDAQNPLEGSWVFKGKIAAKSDKWAIDGSVFEWKQKWYMVWSGWEGDVNGKQDIYIAKMSNPWTIDGERIRLSSPNLPWEKHGDLNDKDNPPHVDVNEGPQILTHQNRMFLIYSASGCWTDHYALGMLSTTFNQNILDSSSWTKSQEPVFAGSAKNGVYAPGHNSFFKSPDGKEDWILYHANAKPNQGCGNNRSPRAQKFSWKNGAPYFGAPVASGIALGQPAEK